MAVNDEPLYYRSFDEQRYKEQETLKIPSQRFLKEEYHEKLEVPRERAERRTIHKMLKDEEELEPLKQVGPKVIGNLFDRVDFLKTRITEVQSSIDTRKKLHEDLIKEVDTDINDKKAILAGLSDVDDIRDFKLDISTLRMEKRRESVLFWRDMVQLTTEIRELMEEFQTESKIADLFNELKSGD